MMRKGKVIMVYWEPRVRIRALPFKRHHELFANFGKINRFVVFPRFPDDQGQASAQLVDVTHVL
jgi:hypothetical protein